MHYYKKHNKFILNKTMKERHFFYIKKYEKKNHYKTTNT